MSAPATDPRFDTPHWPTEIRALRAERRLEVDFDDGATFSIPAELLRVESPSAEVQGHGKHQKRVVSGKRAVGFVAVEPVGHYAVRIVFDDGHSTGIYSWRYLREMGENCDRLWQDYLSALERRGLSRD